MRLLCPAPATTTSAVVLIVLLLRAARGSQLLLVSARHPGRAHALRLPGGGLPVAVAVLPRPLQAIAAIVCSTLLRGSAACQAMRAALLDRHAVVTLTVTGARRRRAVI